MSSVWNLNNPAYNDLWTDWAQWGFGSVNNENPGPITVWPPPDPSYEVNISDGWYWSKDPYHDSDPEQYMNQPPWNVERPRFRPPGEEAATWRQWERSFIVEADMPMYIGFNCGHGHDYWNLGSRWATILNVDDVVVEALPPIPTIGEAKAQAPGTIVALNDKVVIANYEPTGARPQGYLVLEERDRSSAIKVMYDDMHILNWLVVGDTVYVAGQITKNKPDNMADRYGCTSETIIKADWRGGLAVKKLDYEPNPPTPLGMSCREVGNISNRPGLETGNLLVKVCGLVKKKDTTAKAIWIEDGSNVASQNPTGGLKVIVDTMLFSVPDVGQYISVVGTASCDEVVDPAHPQLPSKHYPTVRPRNDDDVQVIM